MAIAWVVFEMTALRGSLPGYLLLRGGSVDLSPDLRDILTLGEYS
jgi:hypothetical protein